MVEEPIIEGEDTLEEGELYSCSRCEGVPAEYCLVDESDGGCYELCAKCWDEFQGFMVGIIDDEPQMRLFND